ncbi:MAG: ABC transporter ATP-binding protein [Deltaproteobacteria bacterium]|nr:ABC transporter ATP-binding protein [Deltaproteobacteria bacterium]
MAAPPVELDDLWVSYGADSRARDRAFQLCGLALRLEAGQLCAVLGPNGAGKTTLVRAVAGLLRPARGRVRLFGADAGKLGRRAVARRVAVVPQRTEVALGFTVREVVAMGRAPYQGTMLRPSSEDEQAVERALRICELADLAVRPVAELSGGEQKRVHIARALAQQAPVLLLDEAAAHLDIRHSVALYRLVREEVSARSLACLAATHDLNTAARYADRVVLLKAGRIVADGTVEQVMTGARLGEVFETAIHVGCDAASGGAYFVAQGPEG